MATDTKKLSVETFLKESEIRTMRKDIQQAKEAVKFAKGKESIVKKEEILKPALDIKKTPQPASPFVPLQKKEVPLKMESPLQPRPIEKPLSMPKPQEQIKPFVAPQASQSFKVPEAKIEAAEKIETAVPQRKEVPIYHETPVKEIPVTVHVKEDFQKEVKREQPSKRKFMEEVEALAKEEE